MGAGRQESVNLRAGTGGFVQIEESVARCSTQVLRYFIAEVDAELGQHRKRITVMRADEGR